MERKIDEIIKKWYFDSKKAILIRGARQVGKTYSINNFIKNYCNKNYVHVDFSKKVNLIDDFAKIKSSEELLLRLSALFGNKLVNGKTLIFLDEIQLIYIRRDELIKQKAISSLSQDIISAMKEIVEEGKYRFILSGSLLGVTLTNIILNPMGYMDIYDMYPLDFEEYLWAKDVAKETINYLRNCFEKKEKVDEMVNNLFLDYFREYSIIGGMPEIVNSFIENRNLYQVNSKQNQIINYYKQDLIKYIFDIEKRMRIESIYKSIASEINAKNKKFVSSHVIDRNYLAHNNIIDEYLWLVSSGIAIPIYNVDEPISPLALSVNHKTLKLFVNDIGLLNAMLLSTGIREKLLNNEKVINFGAPYENAVAQELNAHGFNQNLYYYSNKKQGEIDFLIEYNANCLPIEVKSGKPNMHNMYNRAALNNVIDLYSYSEAMVLGNCNVSKENDTITNYPIYMIMFINKN